MSHVNTAATEKTGPQPGWKRITRIIASLLILTAAAALILSLVNAWTADTIARHAKAERQKAMETVVPAANVFSELYSDDETILGIAGAYKDTMLKGYCVEVAPKGFHGAISMMVGVNPSGSVTGVVILDHTETADVGARANDPEFLKQYIGKSGTITVNTGRNPIDAITGATITSTAVTEGINTALTAVFHYHLKGGPLVDDGEGDV